MDKIEDYSHAIELLKQGEILVSASFGGPVTYYYLKEQSIIIQNNNLKARITVDEFQKAYQSGNFYLYETDNDLEINQNDKYWRQ